MNVDPQLDLRIAVDRESSEVTGGYTVPQEFYQQLMTLMAEETLIRPRPVVMRMGIAAF